VSSWRSSTDVQGGASLHGGLALDYRYRLNVPGTQCEYFRLAFRATSGTPVQRRGSFDSRASTAVPVAEAEMRMIQPGSGPQFEHGASFLVESLAIACSKLEVQ
jgi:hypothetical protein